MMIQKLEKTILEYSLNLSKTIKERPTTPATTACEAGGGSWPDFGTGPAITFW